MREAGEPPTRLMLEYEAARNSGAFLEERSGFDQEQQQPLIGFIKSI